FAFEPLDTTIEDGLAIAHTSTFGVVFLASTEPNIVGPGPRPELPDGPTPTAGTLFDCPSGGVVDLTHLQDTAAPAPTTTECPEGVGARIGETLYADLHGALAAVEQGQTVEICPGIHEGPFAYVMPEDVTLEGIAPEREATVLTARLLGSVLQGRDLTLRRLTIRRGYSRDIGGGAQVLTLVADDVVFLQNVACSLGGGAGTSFGPSRIIGSLFEANVARDVGAGLAYISLAPPSAGGLEVVGTTFRANAAERGAGAWLFGGGEAIRVVDSAFDANTSRSRGGGLSIENERHGILQVLGSTFTANVAGEHGGAIEHYHYEDTGFDPRPTTPATLVIEGGSFVGNQAGTSGGALLLQPRLPGDAIRLTDSVFTANTAPTGAALHLPMTPGATQGAYVFAGLDLDQPEACAFDVEAPVDWPITLAFTDLTLVGDEPICLENATATLDGQPYP
ncbi:MAG: hypothetical protein H6734_25270, partial [Alphaproteobacteria bacterium]|nr:hypothetical protein [Alphaproteobacteria bacterium]